MNRRIARASSALVAKVWPAVWGDYSDDPGPTHLLDAEGTWAQAPPMPVWAGTGHPGSVQLGHRILALTEGSEVAIFDIDTPAWSVHQIALASSGSFARQSVWTGRELLTWTGDDIWSWIPPN